MPKYHLHLHGDIYIFFFCTQLDLKYNLHLTEIHYSSNSNNFEITR
jgi:hypothetical protein